jgi:hypothetical protein
MCNIIKYIGQIDLFKSIFHKSLYISILQNPILSHLLLKYIDHHGTKSDHRINQHPEYSTSDFIEYYTILALTSNNRRNIRPAIALKFTDGYKTIPQNQGFYVRKIYKFFLQVTRLFCII